MLAFGLKAHQNAPIRIPRTGAQMSTKSLAGLSLVLVLTAFGLVDTDAHAGTCQKDTREITFSKSEVIRLNEYSCRSDHDSQVEVRIQFQRLSGLAPGSLLNGGSD